MSINTTPIKFLVLLLLVTGASYAQRKKKVEFTGGARSIVQNSNLNTLDTVPDTTSLRKTTGGYALIDLGVMIRPNNNTEIMGQFRIRNDFGGFWGAGVTFDVRQLWLKGVLGGVLKYQVGDINLKQTPFTLYNHHADRIDSMPEIFQLQNDIINYENFYSPDNTWRQQGIALDWGLSVARVLKEIDFNLYTTRLRATDFATNFDRLMPGGSVDFWFEKGFSIGYNINATVDIPGTVNDTNSSYRNTVQSVDLNYQHDFGENRLDIGAEFGTSSSSYDEVAGVQSLRDQFAHFKMGFEAKNINSKFTLGFLNVGQNFRSVAAQSKDINYAAGTDYFPIYTIQKNVRPISIYDVMTNTDLYERTVSTSLMPMNPVYNNIDPYGLATFNRTGLYFLYTYKNPFIQVDFQTKQFAEIIGQGTNHLRQFMSYQLLTDLNVKELADIQKNLNFRIGLKSANTKRAGDVPIEEVSLDNFRFQIGADWEFFENFYLMGGYIMQNTSGNEFITDRDKYTQPVFYTNNIYDLQQNHYAIGLKYRFSNTVNLSTIYQSTSYNDQTDATVDYDLANFMILFNMTF